MIPDLDWADDVLPGHQAASIALDVPRDGDADDGELVATLVRRGENRHRKAVLYVHGYADYYFQTHLAEAWEAHGYDFYAIDLRRYGRSLRPGNRPNYVDSVDDYFTELDIAVATAAAGHDEFVLHGHSTGGLVCAVYGQRGGLRSSIDAMVLNSPWLDVKLPLVQAVMWRVVERIGQHIRFKEVAGGESFYVESIHTDLRGEWDFDLGWKTKDPQPVYPGWARAIARAHREVHAGMSIGAPILVQHSDRSVNNDTWSEALRDHDSVLSVEQIHRRAPLLGPEVTIQTIAGGMHDLWLSREDVRAEVSRRTFDWLARR